MVEPGVDLFGGDTYCIVAADFPAYAAGPRNQAPCKDSCKFLEGLESAEACHNAILLSGCSSHFAWRAADGRCWGKGSDIFFDSSL